MNLTDWHWTHSHQQALLHAPQWSAFYSLISRRKYSMLRGGKPFSVFRPSLCIECAADEERVQCSQAGTQEEKIRFLTPLKRLHVLFDLGTVTYNSPEEAAEDPRRGLTVGRDGYPADDPRTSQRTHREDAPRDEQHFPPPIWRDTLLPTSYHVLDSTVPFC